MESLLYHYLLLGPSPENPNQTWSCSKKYLTYSKWNGKIDGEKPLLVLELAMGECLVRNTTLFGDDV